MTPADVTSYSELVGAIQARIGELGIRQLDFDVLAGFPAGLSGKVFGPCQVKRLGPEKMFDALRAAGLKLRIEPDPEQLAKMQHQIAEHCLPRQANQARSNNHSSPVGTLLTSRVFRHYAKLGGKKSWAKKTKKQKFDHQSNASNARWKKYRRAAKAKRRAAAHRAANAAREARL